MSELSSSLPKLAMRLRALTQRPPNLCLQFLEALPETARAAYVEHMEAHKCSLLVDPVELDPVIQSKLEELKKEAEKLHERGEFGRGMGSGGRLLAWVKQQLLARHGVTWRTPLEMNPECAFD